MSFKGMTPERELAFLRERMSRLFDETLRAAEDGAATWGPSVDAYETELAVVVTAELPGLVREDVTVEVSGDELILRGERRFGHDRVGLHRLERSYGGFARALPLPAASRRAEPSVTLEAGVLRVELVKGRGA